MCMKLFARRKVQLRKGCDSPLVGVLPIMHKFQLYSSVQTTVVLVRRFCDQRARESTPSINIIGGFHHV